MMVSLTSLWMPIVLSAVIVFVASSIMHMVLKYHNTDYRKLPAEDDCMDALRRFNIPPGDYMMPCPGGPEGMRSPAFLEKLKKGPVAMMTVMRAGPPTMGPQLVQWFVFCLVVSTFAAYVSSRALPSSATYLAVFRFAGCTAFTGYALALWQDTIWYKRAWTTTFKSTIDGLVYGLLTAGTFGWLWPR
jgi:hypothetical protein